MSDNITEPRLNPEVEKYIEKFYDIYFKQTARTNVYTRVMLFIKENKIDEKRENVKEYIKYNRIGIPDYIFWKYNDMATCDDSLNTDEENRGEYEY